MTNEGLKPISWSRVIIGSILLEVALVIISVPVFALNSDPNEVLGMVVPPASFLIALPLGIWAGRASGRPVAAGALVGVVSLLIYGLLVLVALQFAPGQGDASTALSPAYLTAHFLKIFGGGVGGYWVARKRSELEA